MSNYGYGKLNVQEDLSANSLILNGATTGTIKITPSANTTSYTLILPSTLPTTQQAFFIDSSGATSFKSTGQVLSSFNAANNISTAQSVSGVSFNGSQFSYNIDISITATTNYGSLVQLSGVLDGTNTWRITQSYIGDNTGILFSISSTGNLLYTSPSFTGWVSTTFTYYSQNNITPTSTNLNVGQSYSSSTLTSGGAFLNVLGNTFTDNIATSSVAVSNFAGTYISAPTLSATNLNVTTTKASTLEISGAPIPGTNETISSSYALNVDSGNVRIVGNIYCGSTINSSSYTSPFSNSTNYLTSFNGFQQNWGSFTLSISPNNIYSGTITYQQAFINNTIQVSFTLSDVGLGSTVPVTSVGLTSFSKTAFNYTVKNGASSTGSITIYWLSFGF
jgi:hypothetical protein